MAKNKVYVDVVVDDKGTTKKVALTAKQAAKAFGEAGKAAGTADRNIKGAGQSTNNTTKAFSKMQQGTGGLVGAYAALAAQIFAISAAFNFLKRAGDLKVLQAGQTAYASATGIALRSLTQDIIAATDAQITFQDAAQSAAIGTAAGLSSDQLTRLGKAAKDTSIILGRDVTDSFNRLVRGVTKAEPELLDELGVILRLETATEQYAAQLGKSAKDLTAFERSQAVANDVLSQTEQKYSKILEITGGSANIYAQLGKSFDDVLMKVKEVVDVIAGPFAKVLKDTPALAIASLGLLLTGPLKALGINFKDITADAKASAVAAQAYYEKVSIEAKKATLDQKVLGAQFQDTAAKAAAANTSSPVLQRAATGTMTKTDKANLAKALKSAENNYNKHGIVVRGIFKGMSRAMVTEMALAFEQVNLAEQNKLSKTKVWATKASALYAGVAASVKSIGASLAIAGTRLLSVLGYVGIAVTVFQLLKDALGFGNDKLSAQEQLYQKNRESLSALNKELSTFAEIQKVLAKGTTSIKPFGNIGSVLSSRTTEQATEDFKIAKQADTATRTFTVEGPIGLEFTRELGEDKQAPLDYFKLIQDSLKNVKEETNLSLEPFDRLDYIIKNRSKFTTEDFLKARNEAIELSNVINNQDRIIKDARDSLQSFSNSLGPKNQAEQTIDAIGKRLRDIQTIIENTAADPFKGFNLPEGLIEERDELFDKQQALIELNNKAVEIAALKNNTQIELNKLVLGQTEAEKDIQTSTNNLLNLDTERKAVQAEIQKILTAVHRIQKGEITPAQTRQLTLLGLQAVKLDQQKLTEEQILAIKKQQQPFLEEIERQKNIQYALNAEKEILSVAQKRLQLEQQRVSIVESRASREIEQILRAERQSNPFAYLTEDRRRAELEYQKAVEVAEVQKKAIDREAEIKKQLINLEYALLDAKLAVLEQELLAKANDPTLNLSDDSRMQLAQLSGEVGIQRGTIDSTRTSAIDAVDENTKERKAQLDETVAAAKEARDNLQEVNKFMDDIGRSIESNLTSALTSLIDGTKSAKEAFADMAVAILKDIAAMIAKQLVLNALIAATGGAGGFFGSLFAKDGGVFEQARDGGIISEGKKVPGYSSGGVSRGSKAGYPAILHGTEAVVPLPNNRSIPVELKGAGGQQNNVTVNVAIDNNGNAQQNTQAGSSAGGADLGKAIAAAVQKELMNQKRPGGMLSPHGVA